MADFDKNKNKGAMPPPSPLEGKGSIPVPGGVSPAGPPVKVSTAKDKENGVLDAARKRLEDLLKSKSQEQQSKWKDVVNTLYEENKTLKDRMSSGEFEQKLENDKREMELRMYREDVDRKIKTLEKQLEMEKDKVSRQASRLQEDQKSALKVEMGLREVLQKSNREKEIKQLKGEKEKLYNELEEYRKKVDITVEEMKLLQQKQEDNNIRWGEEINEKNAEVIAIKALLKSREEDLEELAQKQAKEMEGKEEEIDKIMEKLQVRFEVEKKRFDEELGKNERNRDALITKYSGQTRELEKSLKNSEEKRLLAEAFQARSAEQKAATDKLFAQISEELKKREVENNTLRNRMNNEILDLKNEYYRKEQAIVKEKMDLEYKLKISEKEVMITNKAYDDALKLTQAEYDKNEKKLQLEVERLRERFEEGKTVNRQQSLIAEKKISAMQEKVDKSKQGEESARMKLMDMKKAMADANEQLQAQLREKEYISRQMNQKIAELGNEFRGREKDLVSETARLESRLKETQDKLNRETREWKEKLKEAETEKSKFDDSLSETSHTLRKREKEFKAVSSDMEENIENLEHEKGRLERELFEEKKAYEEKLKGEESRFQAMISASKQKESELVDRTGKLEARLREQSIDYSREKALLDEKLIRSEEDKVNTGRLVRRSREKTKAMEREIEYFEQEVKELEKRIDDERSTWKDRLKNAVREKSIVKDEMSRREEEFRSEKEEMLDSVGSIKDGLEEKIRILQEEHKGETKTLVDRLNKSKEAEFKSENRKLKDELENQKKKARVLISAVKKDDSLDTMGMLQEQENEWKAKLEVKEKGKLEADNTMARINLQLNEARKQLSEHEEKNQSIIQEIEKKDALIESFKSNMKQDEKGKLEERQKLEEKLNAYREDLKKKEEEYRATRAKLQLELNLLKSQKKKEDGLGSGLEKDMEKMKTGWEVRLKNSEAQLQNIREENEKLQGEVSGGKKELKEQIQQRDDRIKEMIEQLSKEGTPDTSKLTTELKLKEEKLKTLKKRMEDELDEQSSDSEALFMQLKNSLKKKDEEIKSLKNINGGKKPAESKAKDLAETVPGKTEAVKPVSVEKKAEVKQAAVKTEPVVPAVETPEFEAIIPEAASVEQKEVKAEPVKTEPGKPAEPEAKKQVPGDVDKKGKLKLEPRKLSLTPPVKNAKPTVKYEAKVKPKMDEKKKAGVVPAAVNDKTGNKKGKKLKKEEKNKVKNVKKEKKPKGKVKGKSIPGKFWGWLNEPVHN